MSLANSIFVGFLVVVVGLSVYFWLRAVDRLRRALRELEYRRSWAEYGVEVKVIFVTDKIEVAWVESGQRIRIDDDAVIRVNVPVEIRAGEMVIPLKVEVV